MAFDTLSDVLKTVRLTGATFFDVQASAPWAAESSENVEILRKNLPRAGHFIAYHVVVEGRCYASVLGGEPVEMKAGEVVVFARGTPHVLASSPGLRADPHAPPAVERDADTRLLRSLNYCGGRPATAKLVCGFLVCDAQAFNPLLDNLPALIKCDDACEGEGLWLNEFIRLATSEAAGKRPGGETVIAKLSELMFIEVIRRYLQSLPAQQAGWLAGLNDPYIGKALALVHTRPAHPWTIEELGRAVGLSRSVFAERFNEVLGLPPMLYLSKWRMQIASGLLSNSNANIAMIAGETGYASEAAFSRAFKKMMGVPPSALRSRLDGERPVARGKHSVS